MADERSADAVIGGETYELILTTGATKAIAARYCLDHSLDNFLCILEELTSMLD